MYVETIERNAADDSGPITPPRYEDPLDADSVFDLPVVTTRRGLIRVALVATETATRFVRDGIDTDPMAWLLRSLDLFAGGTALEACLEREACLRAVLLHGLSIGLDAVPVELDGLVCGSGGSDQDEGAEGSGIDRAAPVPMDDRSRSAAAWEVPEAIGARTGVPGTFHAQASDRRFDVDVRWRARSGDGGDGPGCSYRALPTVAALRSATFVAIRSPAAPRRASVHVAAGSRPVLREGIA